MVYVKYNQALKWRYNLKDDVDPIKFNEIDEYNEWLVGEMDGDDEAVNDNVFEGDDALTWADVHKALEVGQPRMYTRHTKRKKLASGEGTSSQRASKSGKRGASSTRTRKAKVIQVEEGADLEDIISEESEEELTNVIFHNFEREEAEEYAAMSEKENDYIKLEEGDGDWGG